MIPIMQTKLGEWGNCFMACLASVLEVELNQVPEYWGSHDPQWWYKYNKWLYDNFKLGLVEVQYGEGIWFADTFPNDVYHLCSGPSPRHPQWNHSCVGLNGKVIHDPHPDQTGVEIKHIDLFVTVDPKQDAK